MAARISLALAIHNHQPVGNFGWVIAEVFEQAYQPMVEALERHPDVRLSLHYTGPLLDWLRAERPGFIAQLRGLVERGQVEILGGGYYEPVLASLPERDRIGQLRRMTHELEATFGRRPAGAWLAERVWEPDLPTSLVAAGYDWTILDDAHFRAAAIPEEGLWGPYTTEDQGHLLRVFGTEQGLRYRIPFRDVEEVIDYLRDHATEDGDRIGMMGDDGEKFGAWPTTWEHCWGERHWVERFFSALEANAGWLTTTTPSTWFEAHRPIGRVYIPTSSYVEMGEWALPPDESLVFTNVLHAAQKHHRPEARWLRGAFWRNFQVKYREINDLHKQMLRTSAKVDAMPAGAERKRALDHLYQGQSNDCYWHGLFGGIYIGHMRLATYEHLIAAEDLADRAADQLEATECRDLDLDGLDDVRLAGPGQVVAIHLTNGAAIGGWDIRAVRHALCAVMRRRPEAYHETLREHEAKGPAARAASTEGDGPASIHEIVMTKEPDLAAKLFYDPFERRSGLVRFLPPDTEPLAWATGTAGELERRGRGRLRGRLGRGRPAPRRPRRDGDVRGPRGGGPGDQADRHRRRSPVPQPATRGHGREPIRDRGRRAARPRMDADDARWRRQSGRLDRAGRIARQPRFARDGVGRHGHRPGQRLHRGRDRLDAVRAGRRLVGTGRDDLELGGRVRARLPGSRLPVQLAAGARRRALRGRSA